MIIAEIAGYVASVSACLMFVPQVIKCLRENDASGLSLITLMLSFSCNCGWFINAQYHGNTPLMVSASIIMTLLIPLFYLKISSLQRQRHRAVFDVQESVPAYCESV